LLTKNTKNILTIFAQFYFLIYQFKYWKYRALYKSLWK